jgi:peroxiredoxin
MYGGDPEDFHLVGREKFRGIECFVLESDLRYRTLYVGVADHRLYGKMNRVQTKFSLNSREAVGREIAKEMGHEVKNGKELDSWLTSLSPDETKRYWKESFKRLRPWSRPQMTNWYENYKEIAPGCWLPMHQGTDLWNVEADLTVEPKIVSSTELKVTKATVNQPIPDQRFVWELTEGVDVQDSRYDPMLRYKYKKHFEPAEWRAILDEAAEQKAHLRPTNNLRQGEVYSSTEALGKPAPEFPATSNWINSDPMKMADLKGKIVIMEFWANWSKFSRPDIAKLNAYFERGEKDVVVVSVHAAGTSEADLRKWVKENGIKYPVCIDSPPDKGAWEGSLFNAYHVMEVPMTFVIDRQGKIKSWSSAAGAIVGAHQATTQPAPP